jgi:CheY-like chemotaxis protein
MSQRTPGGANGKKLILIVDDDEALRDALSEALTDEGYAAIGAADGAEALTLLRKMDQTDGHRPSAILLDLMMPGMNGWQFREAQRMDAALSSIPVVFMTANSTVKPSSCDCDQFLRKPITLDDLLEVVARY